MYDIIVIGSGPAGLTAAIYALRAEKSVLVIEKGGFGGQMTFSPKIENYPGFTEISGSSLAEKMADHAISLGAEFELDTVTGIIDGEECKTVVAEGGSFEARAVVIAAGASHRHTGAKGEDELIGSGVSFCAVCDGAFYKGGDVIVIGGGNSALQEAVLLSGVCRSVTVVQNLSFLTGEEKLIKQLENAGNVRFIYDSVADSFNSRNGELTSLTVANTLTGEKTDIPAAGVFVAIGLVPDTAAFKDIVETDGSGYIVAGEDCLTNVPGIFAAGDCRTKSVRQISTAAADGAAAALAAVKYIRQ